MMMSGSGGGTCCRQCGGSDLEYSETRAETFCVQCGAVFAESSMVESVQFTASASGAKKCAGQFIAGGFGYTSSESREQCLQSGYQEMRRIAELLRLPLHVADSAQRVYLLAVQRSFTVGRPIPWVSAACLYAVCRRESVPTLLLDFCDALKVPVHKLGAIFVKLQRVLSLRLPPLNPEIYLSRFAAKLPLGEAEDRAVGTAVRLVQAMRRDWISTGRRPHGLCGAALLIAGRIHGVKLHAEDVSSVVRMSSHTVDKRLSEFRSTAVAALPAAELATADLTALPTAERPPCWGAAEARAARYQRYAALPDYEPLALPWYRIRQKALEDKPGEAAAAADQPAEPAAAAADLPALSSAAGTLALPEAPDDMSAAGLNSIAAHMVREVLEKSDAVAAEGDALAEQLNTVAAKGKELLAEFSEEAERLGETPETQPETPAKAAGDEEETAAEPPASSEPAAAPHEDFLLDLFGAGATLKGTEDESKLLSALALRQESQADGGGEREMAEETLSDVSDGEIAEMVLGEEERAQKALIWDELTKDVMARVEERWKRRRLLDSDGRRKKRNPAPTLEPAATAADSIRLAFDVKGVASGNLFGDEATSELHELFRI